MTDPIARVKRSINDLRLLAFLFFALSTLLILFYVFGARRPLLATGIAVLPIVVVQVLPATAYVVAALMIKRQSMASARLAMWVSFIQPVVAAVLVVVGNILRELVQLELSIMLIISGGFVLFFSPPLIVQGIQLWRAMRDIRLMPPVTQGFEPIPIAKVAGPDHQ